MGRTPPPGTPGTDGPPTVVIADDDVDIRRLLRMMLTRDGFEVVGEAGDGITAIDEVLTHRPEILVLDLTMPRLTGQEALPTIVSSCPRTMVAILSALPADAHTEATLRLGAFSYYEKDVLAAGLAERLRTDLERFRAALDGHSTLPAWSYPPCDSGESDR